MSKPGTTPMHRSQAQASQAFFEGEIQPLSISGWDPAGLQSAYRVLWLSKAPFLPSLPAAGRNHASPLLGMGSEANFLWRHASTTYQLAGKLSAFFLHFSHRPSDSALSYGPGAAPPSASFYKILPLTNWTPENWISKLIRGSWQWEEICFHLPTLASTNYIEHTYDLISLEHLSRRTLLWRWGQGTTLSGHGEPLIHVFIMLLHTFEHVGTRSVSCPQLFYTCEKVLNLKETKLEH